MGLGSGLARRLAELPPGLALAAALAQVPDLSGLGSTDLSVVVQARARQVSFAQAELLAAAHELARTPWDQPADQPTSRLVELDEFAADQVAVTLTWSRQHAHGQVLLAQDLLVRLPMVFAALHTGSLDLARARLFSEQLALLDDDTARALATRILVKAPTWTYSRLRDTLRYHVTKADPGLAKRRYEQGVTQRRIYLGQSDDGTAYLSATNLPVAAALKANDRLDRLAAAAKAMGDPRTLTQLRVDAALDLLAGQAFTTTPSLDPVTRTADHHDRTDQARLGITTDDDTVGTACARPGTAGHPTFDIARLGSGTTNRTGLDASGGESSGARSRPPDANPPDAERATPPTAGPPDAERAGLPTAGPPAAEPVCPTCSHTVRIGPRTGVTDIVVTLDTLMCLNDTPGQVAGWGPVLADVTRQIALDPTTHTRWRFNLIDHTGTLLTQIETTRRPTAREKAFVKARDLTCRAPGCRRRATRCDDDHRIEATHGGPSIRTNLCVLCRHHHRLRHERGLTHQVVNNTVIWTAPDGRVFIVPTDGYAYYVGTDLDNALHPTPVNQITPLDPDRPTLTRAA